MWELIELESRYYRPIHPREAYENRRSPREGYDHQYLIYEHTDSGETVEVERKIPLLNPDQIRYRNFDLAALVGLI